MLGKIYRGKVKKIHLSNHERRGINSSTRVEFEDESFFNFAEFNLNPSAVEGLEIEFLMNEPVLSLRIRQPFYYILKSNGLNHQVEKSIINQFDIDNPVMMENFLKKYLLMSKNGESLPKIKYLTTKTKEIWNDFLKNYLSNRLFIPFSIKFDLFLYIYTYIKDEQSIISKIFDDDDVIWFNKIYHNLTGFQSANGVIPHSSLTAKLESAIERNPDYRAYILFLLNHIENRVYKKTLALKEKKEIIDDKVEQNFKNIAKVEYDLDDSSNMYLPVFLETEEFDFSKEIDVVKYFNSLKISKYHRYGTFDQGRAMIDNKTGVRFPYLLGALVFELLINGLDQSQVLFFIKNLDKFEKDSPYVFGKKNDDNESKKGVMFTHKEIELLIKKSGYNKGYVIRDCINSFIKEELSVYAGENIFLNTVNVKKSKHPTMYIDENGKVARKSDPNPNIKEYYRYDYTLNPMYEAFLKSIFNNIDMKNFLEINRYKNRELTYPDFVRLLEEHIMNNTQYFITELYDSFNDDENLMYGKKNDKNRPYEELPYFQRVGLTIDDEVENLIFKQIKVAMNTPNAFKDDGNFDEWVKEQEYKNGFSFTDEQLEALRQSYTIPRIFILSGYAGTGKSTITKSIVQRFLEIGYKNIIGCSLAGVAANRLNTLTGIPCQTIHSLLGYAGGEMYMAPAVLDYDLVVVDECSMIDVALFKELISRIDFTRTSLVLIGDDAQLPPINKGEPFADIVSAIDSGYIKPPSAILTKIQRSAGMIVQVANFIRSGKYDEISKELYDQGDKQHVSVEEEVRYINENKSYIRKRVDSRYEKKSGNLEYDIYKNNTFGKSEVFDIKSEDILAEKIYKIFDDFCRINGEFDCNRFLEFQIISPNKQGNRFAVKPFNKEIQAHVHPPLCKTVIVGKDKKFLKNDKVIHIKNSHMKTVINGVDDDIMDNFKKGKIVFDECKIYNGQIGIVLSVGETENTVNVYYPSNKQIVLYSAIEANEMLELAYVLTAHKVQGNEFKSVINIVPFVKTNVGRKYLYSSFTRAKENLYILGKREYFDMGLEKTPVKRNTKMAKLFKELATTTS